MKQTLFALSALALLAGCSGDEKRMPNEVCREDVYNDPAYKKTVSDYAATGRTATPVGQDELRYFQRQTYEACMSRRGLAPPGGVQAPYRPI